MFVVSLLCAMSAPFIGAYAWAALWGAGVITKSSPPVRGIKIGSIYGFGGILFVQSLKLFLGVYLHERRL